MTRTMTNRSWAVFLLFVTATGVMVSRARTGAQGTAQQILDDAATAIGGRDRIMAVKTMLLEGAGNFVGITSLRYDDDIGFKSAIEQLRDVRRAYDLANGRARFELTRMVEYVFYIGDAPTRTIQGLDGKVAFNVNPVTQNATPAFGNQGTSRRLEYLRHPLTLVRAALGPNAKLTNGRTQGTERLVDIAIDELSPLTLAIDATTKRPTRIFEIVDNNLFGDTMQALEFGDYKTVNGLQLPTLLTNRQDQRENGQIRIHRTTIDGEVGNLAAPAAVAAAQPAGPGAAGPGGGQGGGGRGGPAGNPAQELAKGLWRVTGTTHHSLIVEFSDHLLVVEANNPERVRAVWARAKELRPNKPITQLIVTHHHFDHTGGVREAVALGVTEIIAHQHNVNFLTEIIKRPHTINPDALAKLGSFKMPKITAIGDAGVVKDSSMTINLYHLRDNTHADSNLLIYFPASKVLTQVDVYMPNDARHIVDGEPLGHAPWNRNVMENIKLRKIQVDTHAPLHGDVVPWSKFVDDTITMTQYLPGEAPEGGGRGGRGGGGRGE
jgi:glyoxylase-like metal-dependent hydrolase (beta-lactamase superfamily II)